MAVHYICDLTCPGTLLPKSSNYNFYQTKFFVKVRCVSQVKLSSNLGDVDFECSFKPASKKKTQQKVFSDASKPRHKEQGGSVEKKSLYKIF